MDSWKAAALALELEGKQVGGWTVGQLLGAGKSAAVFRARRDSEDAAIKVFDRELVERFGKATQLERISRELRLKGHAHPHLIQILDGGECRQTGLLFVVMALFEGKNLAARIGDLPRSQIPLLVQQVASAAEFLESLDLVHRDIKPENIGVNEDGSEAVLLDLGVMRPFGDSGLTDDAARPFIGTLRYSSPEFLLREEMDTELGWRAVTFYQLGGVLHDMIMRRPLFEKYTDPFAVLVQAVLHEDPEVASADVPADLILLARKCLIKDPKARNRLVSWVDFGPRRASSVALAAKERVTMRGLVLRAEGKSDISSGPPRTQLLKHIAQVVDQVIRVECAGAAHYPRFTLGSETSVDDAICTLVLEKSPDRGLGLPLTLRIISSLVDESTLSVEMKVQAFLGMERRNEPISQRVRYAGPIDSEIFAERIKEALWLALDSAQADQHSVDRWIDLEPGGDL